MQNQPHDPLGELLREWTAVPRADGSTVSKVWSRLDGARERFPRVSPWFWLRLAAACFALGAGLGAAVGEWHTLPHEGLTGSPMAERYLESIDPALGARQASGF